MRFACLIWLDGRQLGSLPKPESEAIDRECLAYDEELERTEQLVLAQALEPPARGATVRVRNGKLSATDGPFAETKEQIGGLVLLEARDLEEAIRIAGRSPLARLGAVEVRPVMEASARWPRSRGGRRERPSR